MTTDEQTVSATNGDGAGPAKAPRSHEDRANASLRAARRQLREVSDPELKAKFMLGEASVTAMLAVAESLRND